ncbi:cyclic-phosphate processing receiver domain-containing protein [Acinetobacter sp.]|uniref:cyclic-phosphate processing receiver domain-containing protein n=1 Tax=Acinetobacter sp. TaxID=472 RepID=UPI003D0101FF
MKEYNVLILEDDENRMEQFYKSFEMYQDAHDVQFNVCHVETAADAIAELSAGLQLTDDINSASSMFDLVFLDHDLGGEVYVSLSDENTGSAVARWISEHTESINKAWVIVHSLNHFGARNMCSLIPGAFYIPFIWEPRIFRTRIYGGLKR